MSTKNRLMTIATLSLVALGSKEHLMNLHRSRRILGAALVAASAAVAMAGPLASDASAAAFIRTVESQKAGLQLSISSPEHNAPLVFVPRKGEFVCSTCAQAGVPAERGWEQKKLVSNVNGVSLINKATGMCVDIDPAAQEFGANGAGAKVVLAECDDTPSQQWRVFFATFGNQNTFQNQHNGLILTNTGNEALIQPFNNSTLSPAERAQRVQTFGSVRVE
jgi:hypothetical protein